MAQQLQRWLKRFWRHHSTDLLILGLFGALSCLYWWPLPWHLRTAQLEWPVIDPAFAQWIIGWGARALTHDPWHFFDANMFYPYHHTLAWGDNMFAITLLAIPLIPIFGLLASYNLLLLATSALSAFTLYLLAREIFHNRQAAVVAGIIWGFSYSRYVEYGHIQILALQWLPLAILMAEKLRLRPSKKYWAGLVIFSFLTLTTNIYVAFMFLASIGLYVLSALVMRQLDWPALRRIGLGLLAALILAVPIYLPSYIVNRRDPTVHPDQFSARLDQYSPTQPTGQLVRRGLGLPPTPTNVFSIGLLTLGLAAIGLLYGWRQKRLRPYIVAFATMATFAFVASFGPAIMWHSRVLLAKNPFFYLLFNIIPGYKVLRTPTRWNYIVVLGVAMLAGLGFTVLSQRLKKGWQLNLALIMVAGWIFLENLPAPVFTHPTYNISNYPVYQWLATQPTDQPILELPNFPVPWRIDTGQMEAKRIFLSTYHWHPRAGGGIEPYIPVDYQSSEKILSNLGADPAAMALVRQWHIKYIIYLPEDFDGPSWNGLTAAVLKARLDHQAGLREIERFGNDVVYEVD